MKEEIMEEIEVNPKEEIKKENKKPEEITEEKDKTIVEQEDTENKEETEIKGRPTAIYTNIFLLTKLWRHTDIIKSEKMIIKNPEAIPSNKLNTIVVFKLWKARFLSFFSNSSETMQVVAILKPEVPTVTKNR